MNNRSHCHLTIFYAGLVLLVGHSCLAAQQTGAVPTRDQVEERYTWDVTDLFDSDAAWEEAFKEAGDLIGGFGPVRRAARQVGEDAAGRP